MQVFKWCRFLLYFTTPGLNWKWSPRLSGSPRTLALNLSKEAALITVLLTTILLVCHFLQGFFFFNGKTICIKEALCNFRAIVTTPPLLLCVVFVVVAAVVFKKWAEMSYSLLWPKLEPDQLYINKENKSLFFFFFRYLRNNVVFAGLEQFLNITHCTF